MLINVIHSFFDQLPTAIHIYRCDTTEGPSAPCFVAANPAAQRAFGSGTEGAPLEEAFPALRGAGIAELCARVASSGAPASLEGIRLNGKQEGALVLRVNAFPLAEGCVGVAFEDIRELEEMRQLRIAYQAAIDVVPDVLFVKSADGLHFVLGNQFCAEGLGATTETLSGKHNEDFFPPDVAERLSENDASVAAGHERVFFEEEVPIEGRGLRFVHTTKVPVRDQDDKPLYLVGWVQDMTERKKAAEELSNTQEDLHQTIRALSTPVLPIHKGVLVMPLIGRMNRERGEQLMDALLEGIQRHRARIVIIDITGVKMVDSEVARHLLEATRASALLGTECVLVGIAPSLAQTLLQLGIDLGALKTRRDLEAGVAYALEQENTQG